MAAGVLAKKKDVNMKKMVVEQCEPFGGFSVSRITLYIDGQQTAIIQLCYLSQSELGVAVSAYLSAGYSF